MVINKGRKYVYQFNNDNIFLIPNANNIKMVSISSYEDEDFSFFMFGPEIYKEIEMGVREVVIDDIGTFSNCVLRVRCPNPGNNIEIKILELDGSVIFNMSDILYHYNEGTDNVINTRTSVSDDAFWVTGKIPEDWEETGTKYYTVTYMSDDEVYATQLVEANKPVPFLDEEPTKRKHNFIDWYLEDEYGVVFDPYVPITKDVTVYAKWERIVYPIYKVMFMSNGEIYNSQSVEEYDYVIMPPIPYRKNMIFAGWYLDTSYTRRFNPSNYVDGDLMIFAKWYDETGAVEPAPILFTVSLYSFGKVYKELVVPKNGYIDFQDAPPPRDGYTFYGWYDDEDTTFLYNFYRPIREDTNIYAKWIGSGEDEEEEIFTTNTLRFNVNQVSGATFVEEYETDGIYYRISVIKDNIEVSILKSGEYILTGVGRNVYVDIAENVGFVIIHFYNFCIDNSTLHREDNDIKSIIYTNHNNMIQVEIDGNCSIVVDGEFPDDESMSYCEDDSSLVYNSIGTMSMIQYNGIEGYSQVQVDCIVTFMDGDEVYLRQAVKPGALAPFPRTPRREGYIFQGWFLDSEGETLYNFYKPVYENTTLYSSWIEDDVVIINDNSLLFSYDDVTNTTDVQYSTVDGMSWQEDPETKAIEIVITKAGSYSFSGEAKNIYITVKDEIEYVDIHFDDLNVDNTTLIAKNRTSTALIETEGLTTVNMIVDKISTLRSDAETKAEALICAKSEYTVTDIEYLYYTKLAGNSYAIPSTDYPNIITFTTFLGKTEYEVDGLDGMYIEKDNNNNLKVTIAKAGTYTLTGTCVNTYVNIKPGLSNVTLRLVDFIDDTHNMRVIGRYSVSLIENHNDIDNVRVILYGSNIIKTTLPGTDNKPLYSFGTPLIVGPGTIEYLTVEDGTASFIAPKSIDLTKTDNVYVFFTENDKVYIMEGNNTDGMFYVKDETTGNIRLVISKPGTYIFSGETLNTYIDIMNGVNNVVIQFVDLRVDNSNLTLPSGRSNAMISSMSIATKVTLMLIGDSYIIANKGSNSNPIIDDIINSTITGTGTVTGELTTGEIVVLKDDPSASNSLVFSIDDNGQTIVTGVNLDGISHEKDNDGNIKVLISKQGSYSISGEGKNVYIMVDYNLEGVTLNIDDFHIDNTSLTISNYIITSGSGSTVNINLNLVSVLYSNILMNLSNTDISSFNNVSTLYIPKNN